MLNRHQFHTYYHGTHSANAESISKHGLKAHDPEEMVREEGEEPYEYTGHPKGVYLADTLDLARSYGDAVFSVELPNSADWGWTESEGSVLSHDIPPFMLKRVE
jgi:hypothetical protein